LPSIEEKLRVLDAALVALEKPGLSMAEISRLNKIILGVKVYQEAFVHFVNYRAKGGYETLCKPKPRDLSAATLPLPMYSTETAG
jgi:hypothetical protein